MVLDVLEVEDHPDDVVLVLGEPDLLEQPVPHGKAAVLQVRVQAGADEVHEEAIRVGDAVVEELDLLVQVDDDAGGGVTAPGAEVGDLHQTRRGRAGQGRAGRLAAEERLHLTGPRRVGKGVEIGLAGLGDALAVVRDLGHLHDRPERVVAQAAARVLTHQGPVGLDRVVVVARGVEAGPHLAIEVSDGQEGVVGVPALGVARDEAAVAQDDALPLGGPAREPWGGLEGHLGLLGLQEERGIGSARRSYRHARRPRRRRREGRGPRAQQRGKKGGRPAGRTRVSGHLGQESTVSK